MVKRSSFENWRKVCVEIPRLVVNLTWTKLLTKLSEPQFHHISIYSGFLLSVSQSVKIKCVNNCKTSNITQNILAFNKWYNYYS